MKKTKNDLLLENEQLKKEIERLKKVIKFYEQQDIEVYEIEQKFINLGNLEFPMEDEPTC